jgi:hypothetical protein
VKIENAGPRLELLLRGVCGRPEMADLVPELERIFQSLRDHVFFLDDQKRQLDELRQELEAL